MSDEWPWRGLSTPNCNDLSIGASLSDFIPRRPVRSRTTPSSHLLRRLPAREWRPRRRVTVFDHVVSARARVREQVLEHQPPGRGFEREHGQDAAHGQNAPPPQHCVVARLTKASQTDTDRRKKYDHPECVDPNVL